MRDLRRILEIERECFQATAWPADLFREYAASCAQWFLVAKAGRRIAGYSIACVNRGAAEIASIAVALKYRGRGMAKRLLRYTMRKLERAGVRNLRLTVRPGNTAAIELYRGLGFRRQRTVRNYYEDGSDGWRMQLNIPIGR